MSYAYVCSACGKSFESRSSDEDYPALCVECWQHRADPEYQPPLFPIEEFIPDGLDATWEDVWIQEARKEAQHQEALDHDWQ